MVERKCSGLSWIQLMRGPRWEADSWFWDCPIVMGEPGQEGETPLQEKMREHFRRWEVENIWRT